MAKKVVATLKSGKGKEFSRVIKMVKSPETGAYSFREAVVHNDQNLALVERYWKAEYLSHEDVEFKSADGTKLHGWLVEHKDPRAVVLKRLSKETGERHGDTSWYEISEAIERTVAEQKGLFPNVDFYAASVYHTLGIPTDLMTPIFALARMAGWTAHVREQYADNRVIRPGSEYIGPRDQSWVPIDER